MLNLRTVPVILVITLSGAAFADSLQLPDVLSNHMVLQQGEPVRIWGTADAGATVEVSFARGTASAVADAEGKWIATLEPMAASARGRTLTVRSGSEVRNVNDVLVGEVWLCSGQSNMVWAVGGSQRAEEFTAGADDPRIRMFFVPNTATHEPEEHVNGDWRIASPETVGRFSAVAYHFARNLMEHLDVPIGLVNSAWGGSAVEAWTSRPVLEGIAEAQPYLEAYDKHHAAARMDVANFVAPDDNPAVELSRWESMRLPILIEDAGYNIDGMMWFRRTVDIPAEWAGRPLTLSLGPIDDNDVTYFNGKRVGATNNHRTPRSYVIPGEIVTPGATVIAVRAEDTGGAGGFNGTPDQLTIHPVDDDSDRRSLAGDWHFRITSDRATGAAQHRPANLYNGMIYPLRHYEFRGAIWYQGENNAIGDRGPEYFTIFPAMIHDWRRTFDDPEFPFYFVQLPNFTNNESNTPWRYPLLRQAQLETFRKVPHTGMAVTLELGEANDIHPKNKHDVGERLALWALADTYGKRGFVKSGPIVNDATFGDDGSVHLAFDLYGSRLAVRSGADLTGFELAGEDGVFHGATAHIRGARVIVTSPDITAPTAVRYGWKNNAEDANLINATGLPASPFVLTR